MQGNMGLNYSGSESEYKVIDIASQISARGVFLIPQNSSNLKYSNRQYFETAECKKFNRFNKETGLNFEINSMGLDTSCYSMFKNTNITTEIVECDFYKASISSVFAQNDLFAEH